MINMVLIPESQNTKTGNILQSYSSPSFCPVSCPFKAKGIPAVQCPHRLRESPARSIVFAPETGNPWYSLKSTVRAKERPVG